MSFCVKPVPVVDEPHALENVGHDPGSWAKEQFSGAGLSDRRRQERLISVATAMASHPGRTIPQLFERPYDVKATYTFFQHPEATPERLQARHREMTRERLSEPGTVLLLEDTTELTWFSNRPISGLGPVGASTGQGFLLHSVLAVRWSSQALHPEVSRRPALDVIGLADQQYYIRRPVPRDEVDDDQAWKKRPRESQLWEKAGARLGPAPDETRWVRVCDRGADIYEFLQACLHLNHGFVVRAAQDRALHGGGRLFETGRQAEVLGRFDLSLRTRPKQVARLACLRVSAVAVSLRAPQRPGHSTGKLPPVNCTLVRVWEDQPPPGTAPLEWFLLIDEPVADFETALTCALQYATRWVIEDFHKALKTGLGAERLQLEDAHRLFAAIAVMSVVALRLLDLRERLRVNPTAPASEAGLTPIELQVLERHTKRKLKTVAHVALALGRLGGHMNRRADGMPGLITLWRGMNELQSLVAGATQGLQLNRFG